MSSPRPASEGSGICRAAHLGHPVWPEWAPCLRWKTDFFHLCLRLLIGNACINHHAERIGGLVEECRNQLLMSAGHRDEKYYWVCCSFLKFLRFFFPIFHHLFKLL